MVEFKINPLNSHYRLISILWFLLKLFQNRKDQKNFRYPTKKQSLTAFLSGTSILFGSSYFETALKVVKLELWFLSPYKQMAFALKVYSFMFWICFFEFILYLSNIIFGKYLKILATVNSLRYSTSKEHCLAINADFAWNLARIIGKKHV